MFWRLFQYSVFWVKWALFTCRGHSGSLAETPSTKPQSRIRLKSFQNDWNCLHCDCESILYICVDAVDAVDVSQQTNLKPPRYRLVFLVAGAGAMFFDPWNCYFGKAVRSVHRTAKPTFSRTRNWPF